MSPSPDAAPQFGANPAEPPQGDKAGILLVGQSPDKSRGWETALATLNQPIVRARSSEEALQCLARQEFAVIVLEADLPGADGFETAARIRRLPRSELTPIILVGAANDAENRAARALALGRSNGLFEAVSPEILRAKAAVFVELFRKVKQAKRDAEEHARALLEQSAQAEAEAAQQRLAFLAEASNVLAASLDDAQTYQNLGQLIVPRIADGCVIDILQDDGSLRSMTIAHRDPAQQALITGLRARYPVDPHAAQGVARVLRTGKAEVCERFDAQTINGLARDEGQRELLSRLNLNCFICAPLCARGRMLGVLSLLDIGSAHSCGPSEIWLAEEVAQRAALALDNAALYKTAQAARREAERANLAKDRFLAMLSHELRTPLTPVLASVHLLEADDALPASAQASIQTIRRNVELEARLIDDLLDLTRITKGRLQLNLATVDAHALLQNVFDICRADLLGKRLELRADLAAADFHLLADPARIQQIFWNLLKNAVKFTPEGGAITLCTGNDAFGALRVEVADTGMGIEAALLPRIFNTFEQNTGGVGMGGLGLGLAIAKALVDVHRGKIRAESPGPGQGAKFTVTLPTVSARDRERRAVQPSASSTAVSSPAAPGGRLPLRILLVDDHEDTNRSLTLLLGRRGYQVKSAANVADAVALADSDDFDLLLSDMGLPDGNGLDLIHRLRRMPPLGGIVLSGYGMEEDIQRSKAAGFKEHLSKPVDINRLDDLLQQLARSRHQSA